MYKQQTCVIHFLPSVTVTSGGLFAVMAGVMMKPTSYASSYDIPKQLKMDPEPLPNHVMGESGWMMLTVAGRNRNYTSVAFDLLNGLCRTAVTVHKQQLIAVSNYIVMHVCVSTV